MGGGRDRYEMHHVRGLREVEEDVVLVGGDVRVAGSAIDGCAVAIGDLHVCRQRKGDYM